MNEEFVKTSDMTLAAYLMLKDFTLITCIDPEDGRGRYEFYLTHADKTIRDDMFKAFNQFRDDYSSVDYSYQEFAKHLKKLRKLTFEPIKRSDYER